MSWPEQFAVSGYTRLNGGEFSTLIPFRFAGIRQDRTWSASGQL